MRDCSLRDGFEIKDVTWIRGTCYKAAANPDENKFIQLPHDDIMKEQEGLCGSFAAQFKNNDAISAKAWPRNTPTPYGSCRTHLSLPEPLELDEIYELPSK